MDKKITYLAIFSLSLAGCAFASNNYSEFNEKLGVNMPTKCKRVFHKNETTIDSSFNYDIYQVEEEWKLDYSTQFRTDFEEEFNLDEYIDLINAYEPISVPEKYYIPHSDSLDWVCKREMGEIRNFEWLLVYDNETKMLYALDSMHQWAHQAIPIKLS